MDNYISLLWQKWPQEPPSQKEAWNTFLKRLLIMVGTITIIAVLGG